MNAYNKIHAFNSFYSTLYKIKFDWRFEKILSDGSNSQSWVDWWNAHKNTKSHKDQRQMRCVIVIERLFGIEMWIRNMIGIGVYCHCQRWNKNGILFYRTVKDFIFPCSILLHTEHPNIICIYILLYTQYVYTIRQTFGLTFIRIYIFFCYFRHLDPGESFISLALDSSNLDISQNPQTQFPNQWFCCILSSPSLPSLIFWRKVYLYV